MRLNAGFWKNTNGNISIMLGLAMVPVMLGAGAAIDFGRASYARTVLQGAADAAAIAGATSKDKSVAKLQAIVEEYLAANNAGQAVQYMTKIVQNTDSKTGTYNVIVEGSLPTSFMAVAGIKTIDVGVRSQVNIGTQTLEIALVLDNTGSMAGSKIANLKTSAISLVDIVEKETSGNGDTKIAVVPFAEYVNVGTSVGSPSWLDSKGIGKATWGGCVGSRSKPNDLSLGAPSEKYPAVANVPCNVQVLPLTANMASVRSRINLMSATGSTYIPTGLLWGWNVLDNSAPFTEGLSKGQLKATKARRAIILMTDGENTISPSYPTHDGKDASVSNANLTALCNNVKGDDVEIFTVSFMVPSVTIKKILENCATSPVSYFDAANSTDLSKAFANIARDLSAVRLSQ